MTDSVEKPVAVAPARPRPLSPHLQVYRLPLGAITSICHRFSGLALSAGAVVLTAWLWAAATSPACFAWLRLQMASPFGQLCLFGWTLAFYYHLCAGVRHLFWDAGQGFAKKTYQFTNWLVIGVAVALTLGTWFLV